MTFRRLDAARGFAASLVCINHVAIERNLPGPSSPIFHLGSEEVMAFFLLSGFVIHWASHSRGPFEGAKTYFIKRAVRVYSVWVPAMIVIGLIAYLQGQWSEGFSWPAALGNLLMLQDISQVKPAVICDALFNNTPLWSMHYEWWFYVTYPAVLLISAPKRRTHVVGALAILGGITYVLVPNPLSRLLMYFSIWWIGVEAAESMRRSGTVKARDLIRPVVYAVLAIMPEVFLSGQVWRSTGVITAGTHPWLEARQFAAAILLLGAALLWRRLRWIGFNWIVGPFVVIAPISFSLYLVHFRLFATATYFRALFPNSLMELTAYAALTAAFCLLTEVVLYPRARRLIVVRR